jgi:hypothetical protein
MRDYVSRLESSDLVAVLIVAVVLVAAFISTAVSAAGCS